MRFTKLFSICSGPSKRWRDLGVFGVQVGARIDALVAAVMQFQRDRRVSRHGGGRPYCPALRAYYSSRDGFLHLNLCRYLASAASQLWYCGGLRHVFRRDWAVWLGVIAEWDFGSA